MTISGEEHHEDDAEIGRLLRTRLPRYPAPPHLRAAVVGVLTPESPFRPWRQWLAPAMSALAAAMIVLMWMLPRLPATSESDPLREIARAVVNEHSRTTAWGENQPEVISTTLPRVMEETGVTLSSLFAGDDVIQLVSAQPTYVERHRAMALVYRDAEGHTVTYVILPGGAFALPERGRVQIDRWRPLVRRENGFSLILWKQQGLLCALVSDLVSGDDLQRMKQYFVKVRSSTELYPTF